MPEQILVQHIHARLRRVRRVLEQIDSKLCFDSRLNDLSKRAVGVCVVQTARNAKHRFAAGKEAFKVDVPRRFAGVDVPARERKRSDAGLVGVKNHRRALGSNISRGVDGDAVTRFNKPLQRGIHTAYERYSPGCAQRDFPAAAGHVEV